MKGISEWIWIVGGTIIGIILFTMGTIIYQNTLRTSLEKRSLEEFSEVVTIINNLCWNYEGNVREYNLELGETVQGIYAADIPHDKYESVQLTNNIIAGQTSSGNNLCIQIQGKREQCEKLDCQATFPFVGAVPKEFSLSALIKGNVFNYFLQFGRQVNPIEVEVTLKVPSSTTTTLPSPTILPGPTTTTLPGPTTTIVGTTTTQVTTTTLSGPTTTLSSSCSLDDVMGMINKENVYSYESNIAAQPHPAEGWGSDTSANKATRDWIKGKLQEFGLDNVRIETFTYSGATGYSVIGEVGSGTNEIVIGGHRDTVPQAPGAVDNTAGTSTVMEMARVYASKCKNYVNSKNSKLIFALFDSEELGLYGSNAYVQSHSTANVKYMMNFDCPSGYTKDNAMYIWITDNSLSSLVDQCCSSYSLQCEKTFSDPCGYPCSDYAPFQSKGIPHIFPMDKSSEGLCAGNVLHSSGDNLSAVDKDKLVWASKLGTCVLRKLLS